MNLFRLFAVSCFIASAWPGSVEAQSSKQAARPFDFDKSRDGEYVSQAVRADWPGYQSGGSLGRAFIVRDEAAHGKVLRVAFPKGAVGPAEGGLQFSVNIPPADEYWLSYQVKFEPGFDFRKGGKLPGLTSGGSKYTGGKKPTTGDGWSARYMWRTDGEVEVYLYYVDMPGEYGQGIRLTDAKFEPGRWHRLTQHIRVNSGDRADGVLEVWFDDKPVLARNDLRLRLGNQGRIDNFYFSTFHGGQGPEWAPESDGYARFDDFLLDTRRPAFIKP